MSQMNFQLPGHIFFIDGHYSYKIILQYLNFLYCTIEYRIFVTQYHHGHLYFRQKPMCVEQLVVVVVVVAAAAAAAVVVVVVVVAAAVW